MRSAALLGLLAGLIASTTGCLYTRYTTNTKRSATEQLLVGESIRRSIAGLTLPDLAGRSAAVEIRAIPDADTDYLKAVLEARLGSEGARIVSPDQAEFVVGALVGGIGTVQRHTSFGLPSLPIPSLGATPEIPFIAILRQRAWTHVQLVTLDRGGVQVGASEPVQERARFDIISVLFFEFRRNDVYPGESGSLAIE